MAAPWSGGLLSGTGAVPAGSGLEAGELEIHLGLDRALQMHVDVGAHGQALRHFFRALDVREFVPSPSRRPP